MGVATRKDGTVTSKPMILQQAEIVSGLAEKFGVAPDEILRNHAGILQMAQLVQLGKDDADNV